MARRNARAIVTRRILRWAEDQFKKAMRLVDQNLTGRMFQRRTGKMQRDVHRHSKVIRKPRGFRLATRSAALIAWMNGSPRRGYVVRPKKAKALRFEIGGKIVFAKRAVIPPWAFAPKRPVFEDALKRRQPFLSRAAGRELQGAAREVFEDRRVTVRVQL